MKMPKGKHLKQAAMITAGGLGAKVVKNLSKKFITQPGLQKLVPAVPVLVGLLMLQSAKTEDLGFGMIAVGGTDLAGTLVPQLAGLEDMDLTGIFDGDLNGPLNDDINDDLSDDTSNMNGPLNDQVDYGDDYN
jgi:hypothetical protein